MREARQKTARWGRIQPFLAGSNAKPTFPSESAWKEAVFADRWQAVGRSPKASSHYNEVIRKFPQILRLRAFNPFANHESRAKAIISRDFGNSFVYISVSRLPYCSLLSQLFACVGLVFLSQVVEASPVYIPRPLSPHHSQQLVPVQIINSNAGRVMTARAEQYDNKIYVGGLVYRPMSLGIAAHVHVWGVDKMNHQVFFKTEYVFFTSKFQHSASYVASISPGIFAKAKTVFVTFHSQGDAESMHED